MNDTPDQPLILIAMDDAAAARSIAAVLTESGLAVELAATRDAAFTAFADNQPDAVLIALQTRPAEGIDLLRSIRALDDGRELPVLVAVDRDDAREAGRAFAAGASGVVESPVALGVLPDRLRNALQTARSLSDLTGLIRSIPDLIFIVNEDGEVQHGLSGPDATHTLQIKALATANQINFYPCENDNTAIACIKRALDTGRPQVYEHALEALGIHLETRFVARDKHTVLAIVRDITERKKAEEEIYNLAYYDELTELPNRELFTQSLGRTIERAKRDGRMFAVLFVDLDRFKRINDTLGHSIGDQLLKDVAARLAHCIRATDSVARLRPGATETIRLARLGGDEFVIKLYGVDNEETVASIARRIIGELTPPFNCGGHQFVVTPSIGIALYPHDGATGEQLLMNADSAMYSAKNLGRNNFKFYSETMRTRSLHRLDLENQLRAAMEHEQFSLFFQPKVDANTCRLVGAEALLRWHHPTRGIVAPDTFIPVAEETGLIEPIGRWVLHEACRQVKSWAESAVGAVPVSVNISSHQIRERNLTGSVADALAAAGVEPRWLELEITESALLQDVENNLAELKALKQAGISLSIDDFGTGYSSLSYLKRFPIDTIKIDRSFVKELHKNADDAAICAAILAMSTQLGLKVVAEGVETREQLEFLRRHGCHHIQGFLFGKPRSASEFRAFLDGLGKSAGPDDRLHRVSA